MLHKYARFFCRLACPGDRRCPKEGWKFPPLLRTLGDVADCPKAGPAALFWPFWSCPKGKEHEKGRLGPAFGHSVTSLSAPRGAGIFRPSFGHLLVRGGVHALNALLLVCNIAIAGFHGRLGSRRVSRSRLGTGHAKPSPRRHAAPGMQGRAGCPAPKFHVLAWRLAHRALRFARGALYTSQPLIGFAGKAPHI